MDGGGSFAFKILYAHYIRKTSKLGLWLSYETEIGEGVDFPHNFPLIINTSAKIGKCCIIHPNVLIGGDRGKGGAPEVGNYVFIGNGAKIIGKVTIGDWSFISPGAIITKNIPSGCTVGSGVNCILSNNGKENVMRYLSIQIRNRINEK